MVWKIILKRSWPFESTRLQGGRGESPGEGELQILAAKLHNPWTGHALRIWICGCSLFYKRALGLKISGFAYLCSTLYSIIRVKSFSLRLVRAK